MMNRKISYIQPTIRMVAVETAGIIAGSDVQADVTIGGRDSGSNVGDNAKQNNGAWEDWED